MAVTTAQSPARGLGFRPLNPLQSAAGGGLKGLSQLLIALGSGQPELAGQAFSAGASQFSDDQQRRADRARQDQLFDLELEDRETDLSDKREKKAAEDKASADFNAAVDGLWQSGAIDEATRDAIKAGVTKYEAPKVEPEKPPFTGAIKDETGNWVYDPDYLSGQEQLRKAGASNTTVNVGGESKADAAQREALSKKEGERWSALQESGTVAASLQQDFEALDQLIGVAPSGPIEGRLAEAFPGFSSAGDAFQSIVVRVAPTLRTPGSGATSDIEYEGMLKSLPRLRNKPEANRAISEMMKAKAAINVERANVVTAYQNEMITAADARKQLAELNARSIMTPELKAAIGVVVEGAGDGPKVGDVEDGYRFKGGSPADPNAWEKVN